MIKKVMLNSENNSVFIDGKFLGFIVPLSVYFNALKIETNDFIIFNGTDLMSGYNPVKVQCRSPDGAWTTKGFEHFYLQDEVSVSVSVNEGMPTEVILLYETKQLIEV